MIIRNPTDLIGYLSALATQHPQVAQVIYGDKLRPEEATLSNASYPQVDIETPVVRVPKSTSDQVTMWTRIFVLTSIGPGDHTEEDIGTDQTYRIASDLVSAMRAHEYDEEFGLVLQEGLEITPVIALGSDQRRGWMFEMSVEVDPSNCEQESWDVADLFFPQFIWAVSGEPDAPTISIEDQSHGTGDKTWLWTEQIDQSSQSDTAEVAESEISLDAVSGRAIRHIHVWLTMTNDGQSITSYARIDSSLTRGRSMPFVPFHPEPLEE